ncbi:uncharacterized protein LOC144076942 [Stigmatopora argus]
MRSRMGRSLVSLVSLVPLVLLAARLSLAGTEGDPLPASLVDLVRNSPVSSVDDLKLLLQRQANAIEKEDEPGILSNQTHGRHVRSIVEAEIAQQAVCRVRTEVTEVTRSMLDRRNANFKLWPPCVEVQRCSGCCNSKFMQCLPTVTSSRYLQVMKIQYINGKTHYDKAIITVQDHLACRCLSTTPESPFQPAPSLPRSADPAPPRADLRRLDDRRLDNSEEQEAASRQWPQGGYTQLVRWTPPRTHPPLDGRRSDAGVRRGETATPLGQGSGTEGAREDGVPRRPSPDRRSSAEDSRDRTLGTQYRLHAPQSDGASLPGPTRSPHPEVTPTPVLHLPTVDKDSASERPNVKEVTPKQASERQSGRDVDSAERDRAVDSTLANGAARLTEEERRQKVLEVVERELDRSPHLHPQQRAKSAAAEVAPPTNGQTPFRPASPRRRRKHRKRISKEAMRAMIM